MNTLHRHKHIDSFFMIILLLAVVIFFTEEAGPKGTGEAGGWRLSCWLEYNLRPAIVTCVEVLIGIWALGKLEAVGDDLRRFCSAMVD